MLPRATLAAGATEDVEGFEQDGPEVRRLDGLRLRKFHLPERSESQLPNFERVVVVRHRSPRRGIRW